jgi:hypothetical protein
MHPTTSACSAGPMLSLCRALTPFLSAPCWSWAGCSEGFVGFTLNSHHSFTPTVIHGNTQHEYILCAFPVKGTLNGILDDNISFYCLVFQWSMAHLDSRSLLPSLSHISPPKSDLCHGLGASCGNPLYPRGHWLTAHSRLHSICMSPSWSLFFSVFPPLHLIHMAIIRILRSTQPVEWKCKCIYGIWLKNNYI